jgi:Tol biopolymer transport system component
VQITSAALDFRRPTIAADGKKLFAIGWQLRGEVVRYDSDVGQFTPLREFEGVSAEYFSYSRDGEKVAFTSYPERDLWRSNSDGTDRAQLTFEPMQPFTGTMSPDGSYVAFSGSLPEKPRQIYIMPTSGGTPEPITPEDTFETSQTWSPDSSTIAFTSSDSNDILLYDVAGGSVSTMPGSEDLRYPDWSPDGRYIAAWTPDGAVMALDVDTGQRIELLDSDAEIQVFYWANDSEHIFFVDRLEVGREGAMYRLNITDKSTEKVAPLGSVRGAFGIYGVWVGVDPGGAPLMLRDVSIHNIYELDWLP